MRSDLAVGDNRQFLQLADINFGDVDRLAAFEPCYGAVVWALYPIFADAHGVAIGPEQAIFGAQI